MCGFVGIFDDRGRVRSTELHLATSRIEHRGPDDEGYVLGDIGTSTSTEFGGPATPDELNLPDVRSAQLEGCEVGLGFRRLSILDTTPRGHQPMYSRSRDHVLVFNGEIYNYRELRKELQGAGHQFATDTDTEVLLSAYGAWGVGALERLEGMWAFAIVDFRRRLLVLSRDRFGIKPLYWHRTGSRVAFSSEIKSLLALAETPRVARSTEMLRYFLSGVTDSGRETMFAGIERLLPAQVVEIDFDTSSVNTRTYWTPPEGEISISREDAAAEVKAQFIKSVEFHLRSDVPLGVALSGGIDSSSILAATRSLLSPGHSLRSVTYVDDDPALNEEHFAEIAAQHAEAGLHRARGSARDLEKQLRDLTWFQEEPFGSTSIYAQYSVFRATREAGLTVMLDGQGADELFGGYRSYLGTQFAGLLSGLRLKRAMHFLLCALRLPGVSPMQLLASAGGRFVPAPFESAARRLVGRNAAPPWLDPQHFSNHQLAAAAETGLRGVSLKARLRRAFTEVSLPMLLRYEDRNSMAHAIESRVPFLYTPLVELAMQLPDSYLIDDTATTKSVLRRSMRRLVPEPILDRRDKIGFATGELDWLNSLETTVEQRLSSDRAKEIPWFVPGEALLEWRQIRSGKKPMGFIVWRWLNAILWADVFDVSFEKGRSAL